jgi:hypothetical protein
MCVCEREERWVYVCMCVFVCGGWRLNTLSKEAMYGCVVVKLRIQRPEALYCVRARVYVFVVEMRIQCPEGAILSLSMCEAECDD